MMSGVSHDGYGNKRKMDQIRDLIFTDSNYTRRESPGRRLKKIDLNLDCYLPNQKAPFCSAQDSVQT